MKKVTKSFFTCSFGVFFIFIVLLPKTIFAQDIDNGKLVYKRCIACHFVDRESNKIGPSLKNIMGRTAGTKQGYKYSPAMIEAGQNGLIWTKETLKEYLHNSKAMIKGTRMASIRINNDADIDDLIAYIKSYDSQIDE